LNVGSLFTGIGGFDLGLERAGMHIAWQCETDAFCRAVLARHWPGVPCYPDVRTLDERTPAVDVVCGGFPCQPVSLAGRGLGAADERWLWPEFARAVRLLRPRYVLVENVPGLFTRGFDLVLADLAALGYDAEWTCIRAADVGAPHLRERVWIVANAARDAEAGAAAQPGPERERAWPGSQSGRARALADADEERRRGRPGQLGQGRRPEPTDGGQTVADAAERADVRGVAPSILGHLPLGAAGGRDSDPWLAEPDVGRVAPRVSARVDRLRALGNALVPQIAELIGRRLMDAEP
jgi:DNA (cytosine-5)-methyltransferase 1